MPRHALGSRKPFSASTVIRGPLQRFVARADFSGPGRDEAVPPRYLDSPGRYYQVRAWDVAVPSGDVEVPPPYQVHIAKIDGPNQSAKRVTDSQHDPESWYD